MMNWLFNRFRVFLNEKFPYSARYYIGYYPGDVVNLCCGQVNCLKDQEICGAAWGYRNSELEEYNRHNFGRQYWSEFGPIPVMFGCYDHIGIIIAMSDGHPEIERVQNSVYAVLVSGDVYVINKWHFDLIRV